MTALSEELARRFRDQNWTLVRLEEASGVPFATLGRYMRGEGEPQPSVLARLAKTFGIDFWYLMSLAGYPPSSGTDYEALEAIQARLRAMPDMADLLADLEKLTPDQRQMVAAWVRSVRSVRPQDDQTTG